MKAIRCLIVLSIVGTYGPVQAAESQPESMTFVGIIDENRFRERREDKIPSVSTIKIDMKEGRVIYDGDYSEKMFPCSESGWYCLRGFRFNFAIPQGWNGRPESWSFSGTNYTVLDKKPDGPRHIFHISAQRVDVQEPEFLRPSVYLYDVERGLVGFHFVVLGLNKVSIPVTYFRVSEESPRAENEEIDGGTK